MQHIAVNLLKTSWAP